MQFNSTRVLVREMDQQHPPPPLSLPLETAAVHRHATPASARQGLNASELIRLTSPPLPMRLSEARQSNASPGPFGISRERTGLRSNVNRSNPNEYVDEPVLAIHARSEGKPSSSSSSSTPTSESKPPSKENAEGTVSSDDSSQCKESIFCPRCRRCRCIKCRQSRRLPAIRCGQTRLQCLPEEVVDCCSGIWCATAAYRRCSDDFPESELDSTSPSSSEALCALSGHSCCRRWTVLAALSPCLPCLCLYWPLRWLLSACSSCYNCRRRGCHCADPHRAYGGHDQGGTLLISSEDLLSSNSSSAWH